MAGRPPTLAGAAQPDPGAGEAELRAAVAAWAEAIVSNDAARIAEFVTEDWAIVSATGVSPGKRLLELITNGDLIHTRMTSVGDPRVQMLGDTAVVTALIANTAFYRGTRVDADEWTTDVYVRDGDRWLCTLTHYTAATEPS